MRAREDTHIDFIMLTGTRYVASWDDPLHIARNPNWPIVYAENREAVTARGPSRYSNTRLGAGVGSTKAAKIMDARLQLGRTERNEMLRNRGPYDTVGLARGLEALT